MLHPEVQREAQEQLDRVAGKDRLPEFDDIEQCPLVRAIVMKLIRWQPLLPLSKLTELLLLESIIKFPVGSDCTQIYRG